MDYFRSTFLLSLFLPSAFSYLLSDNLAAWLSHSTHVTTNAPHRAGMCDLGWQEYDGACYMFTNNHHNLLDANHECTKHDSKVLEIETAEEDNFLRTLLYLHPDGKQSDVFSGLVYLDPHDRDLIHATHHTHLQHVPLDTWTAIASFRDVKYTNWAVGYPRRTGTSLAACLSSAHDFQWVSVDLHRSNCAIICEKPLS